MRTSALHLWPIFKVKTGDHLRIICLRSPHQNWGSSMVCSHSPRQSFVLNNFCCVHSPMIANFICHEVLQMPEIVIKEVL